MGYELTKENPMEITFSAWVASDHLDRLNNCDDEVGEYEVSRKTKTTWTLRVTDAQLKNIFDDFEYHLESKSERIECGEDRAFFVAMERALASIRKQVRKQTDPDDSDQSEVIEPKVFTLNCGYCGHTHDYLSKCL